MTTQSQTINPNTKKGVVFSMLRRGNGATLQSIVKKLEISASAAQSLINDVKRTPYVTVTREKTARGQSKYKANNAA